MVSGCSYTSSCVGILLLIHHKADLQKTSVNTQRSRLVGYFMKSLMVRRQEPNSVTHVSPLDALGAEEWNGCRTLMF
jgi:hypothetical protein